MCAILCWAQENTRQSRGSHAPTATAQRGVQRGRQELKGPASITYLFIRSFIQSMWSACVSLRRNPSNAHPDTGPSVGEGPEALGQGMGVGSIPLLGHLIQRDRSRPCAWLQCLSVLPSLLTRSLGSGARKRQSPAHSGSSCQGCCSVTYITA